MYKTPPLYNETIPIHDDLSLMKRKKERQAPEANEKMKNDFLRWDIHVHVYTCNKHYTVSLVKLI